VTEIDETQHQGKEENGSTDLMESLRNAAVAVAAGAAVGAAVGAARALTSRDGTDEEDDDASVEDGDEQEEPRAQLDDDDGEDDGEDEQEHVAETEPQRDEAGAGDDDEDEDEDEEPEQEQVAESEAEQEPRAEQEEPRQAEHRDEPGDNGAEPVRGESLGATTDVARRAREQLLALQGREPESISSLERTPDGWLATFEVVELARVPNSMDVMGSYELVLDEQQNMVRYSRTRRYHRAQADGDGGR
jgi:gas vesicle protein GvpO